MHFPEGYFISLETLPNKVTFQTVKSILSHFGISWQDIELVMPPFVLVIP